MSKEEVLKQIENEVNENDVMVYMKGTPDFPQCGFSNRVVQIFRQLGVPFEAKNVLEDSEFRYILQEYSNWPTIPQVFIDGKLIGGSDICMEMYQNGELQELLKKESAAES
ncbi:MAG: Grx4 family monothiol glutaredoxin [Candidatus Marinimicrobia bacterium]|nr:Grx4 family monothiol glutaredoxin [Candidatus Neomarinimicrobiota bacterium]MCF7827606.1 Grx4 family monothiol glutaredoxin [Candidatus Neomarinimicrobiota bacterium]MCF7881533.1 Grx4 family monothiol glutaredoxin [Candidatus Neomarinimicrobiota bacterium]